jgi:hypothetical protein
MNYVFDGRGGILKSWGALNADLQLTAVTAAEVKDQRRLSTYAGAWGGFDVMTGLGPTERTLTVQGRVSNDLLSRDATARVRATLDKLMESREPVAFVSPVASIPRGVLTGATVTQVGMNAIDVGLTIRAVRVVEAESAAGEKAPPRAKKGGKDDAVPAAGRLKATSKATVPAASTPADTRSLAAKFVDWGMNQFERAEKWLNR